MSTETNVEKEPAKVELTINDLINIRNLIDVVSTRGAFKATELTSVGYLFDKLNSFVNSAVKQQEEPAQTNEDLSSKEE